MEAAQRLNVPFAPRRMDMEGFRRQAFHSSIGISEGFLKFSMVLMYPKPARCIGISEGFFNFFDGFSVSQTGSTLTQGPSSDHAELLRRCGPHWCGGICEDLGLGFRV